MKRLIVVSVIVAMAVAALLALRAGAQGTEPRRSELHRVEYGMLIEGLPGENRVCWQTTDGALCARDLDALNERLGGQKIPGAPLNAVFNAVGVTGWQLVLVQKPTSVGDVMWVFSRAR
jgi:hypothetical protein